MKSGNLKFLEHSGPLQACNGTDLPFYPGQCGFIKYLVPVSPQPDLLPVVFCLMVRIFLLMLVLFYTGLFISPSEISDPCGTVAGMVTPKGSMSTEGETLQVSVLPYRFSIC